MKDPNIVNTELEQTVYAGAQREESLRSRASLALIAPVLAGVTWLAYSAYQVTALQGRVRDLEGKSATREQREAELKGEAGSAAAKLTEMQELVTVANEAERTAKSEAAALSKTLLSVRSDLDAIEVAVTELAALRGKISQLSNSEPIESQLATIRSTLNRNLVGIETKIDAAIPEGERKPKVNVFIMDDDQRDTARQLKAKLEMLGYEVGAIVKNSARKVESTEIRFRNPKDKQEAQRIQTVLEAELGKSDQRISYIEDAPGGASGRRFQIWLSKDPSPVAPR